ncbi:SHC SH2 domain-binding protein 1-like [Oncorhynchus keta]|uniref:SHC SH2 domain-binding protein 1-like n=1 Tax=Oncorhynchus keta TaxID=8018 RepID=UPI00227C4AF8|nr:SHC SH2 domain-binding protein 1-like [Oncorhynchus keta]
MTVTVAQRDASLPDTFQTNELLYYERFRAYQDYTLGDCKTSEVKAFTADYLEKVLEPFDWQAQWCTDVFDVPVEVVDVNYKERLRLEAATLHKVPLQELQVVFDESGDFDQTALALEHLRQWDDEDDDFDYFVRCVEPRLRLYEDRVPAGLVTEYYSLLARCSQKFQEFSSLRNGISSDSESELDNVSMVEGLRMYEQMEALKRKLRIIENPLLRYVLGYMFNSGQQACRAKGPRVSGGWLVHVVSVSTTVSQLQSLMADKLGPKFSGEEFEVHFHSEPLLAVSACYEGDVVIILQGHYTVTSSISIPDSISVEGFGIPDEVVIEKKNKGDSFVASTGSDVKVSNVKFIQHDAIEGILCVRQGKLEMENCVLQCETTGVIVRTSAHLTMNMCDLYGSKGAGVEIYPGSVCSMVGNGIHHCKEGILIKDFADELDTMPKITMVNNVTHNNEGYGVILVKPSDAVPGEAAQEDTRTNEQLDIEEGNEDMKGKGKMRVDVDVQLIVVDDCSVKEPVSYSSCYAVPPEFTEGNDAIKRELVATSAKKQRRQMSMLKELGVTQADDNLLSQEMFVSIQDNQFRRNCMGNFSTLY